MQSHSFRNPVLAVAQADRDDGLVEVVEAKIATLERPAGLGGIGPVLSQGSVLGTRPLAFIPYFIVMNAMNYQFWDFDAAGHFVRYAKDGKIGAPAMQSAMQAAWEIARSAVVSSDEDAATACIITALRNRIEDQGARWVFGDIPELHSRETLLLEVLDAPAVCAMSQYLDTALRNGLALGWGQAQALAYHFPMSYGDRYLKKAQLTLMFIAGQASALLGRRVGLDVSAAADYQLPKLLRALGLLHYGAELAELVDRQALIEADSPAERAIRSATVRACESLARQFRCRVEEVDFWLWMNRNQAKDVHFHLTRTTTY